MRTRGQATKASLREVVHRSGREAIGLLRAGLSSRCSGAEQAFGEVVGGRRELFQRPSQVRTADAKGAVGFLRGEQRGSPQQFADEGRADAVKLVDDRLGVR